MILFWFIFTKLADFVLWLGHNVLQEINSYLLSDLCQPILHREPNNIKVLHSRHHVNHIWHQGWNSSSELWLPAYSTGTNTIKLSSSKGKLFDKLYSSLLKLKLKVDQRCSFEVKEQSLTMENQKKTLIFQCSCSGCPIVFYSALSFFSIIGVILGMTAYLTLKDRIYYFDLISQSSEDGIIETHL